MKKFTFQWFVEGKGYHRLEYSGTDEATGWYYAYKKCGWENRTTLGLVGNNTKLGIRDDIVKNWWNAMHDRNLYKFNTLYFSGNIHDRLKSGFVSLTEL